MPTVDLAVLAALPAELAPVLEALGGPVRRSAGIEVHEGVLGGGRVRAAVGGVGKVAAARAAAVLLDPAPRFGLVVVGVCGGLAANQRIGTLVHCGHAVQADLFLPWATDADPDPELLGAWEAVAPGPRVGFLTADRAAMTPWRRLARLARYGRGAAIADMETAAAAWVASSAGIPWAALRAVTDTQGLGFGRDFQRHFALQAPRAAATLPDLVQRLVASAPTEAAP